MVPLNQIIHGDAVEVLRTLPDESVNCVVTSPPYWGLRDYGTGLWEGGVLECTHVDEYSKDEQGRNRKGLAKNANNQDGGNRLLIVQNGIDKSFQYKDVCLKCGARRIDKQLGLEKTPEEYVVNMVMIFREVKRILKKDGTLWVNLGDSYAHNGPCGGGSPDGPRKPRETDARKQSCMDYRVPHGLKPKDIVGIPWRVAFALQADGFFLRQDIIWQKTNPMPESVKDRCTKSHEYIFLLSKSLKYYFNNNAILEPATGYDGRKATMMKGSKKYHDSSQSFHARGHERWRYKNLQADGQTPNTLHLNRLQGQEYLSPVRNKRSVWTIPTKAFKGAHFATFPEKLIEPMILAGCPENGIVLDPFIGAGTTALVARNLGRNFIGIELNKEYIEIAKKRIECQAHT